MQNKIDEKWEIIFKKMKDFDFIYHKIATYYGLSDSCFWILYTLYQNKEGCTQKELCDDWGLTKQTINSSIKDLEKKEYITLKIDDKNRKYKKVCMTKKGQDFSKAIIERVLKMENDVFLKTDEKEMNIVINFFENQLKLFKEESKKIYEEEEHE